MVRFMLLIILLSIFSCNYKCEEKANKEEGIKENTSEFYVSQKSKKEIMNDIVKVVSHNQCSFTLEYELTLGKELEIERIIEAAKEIFENRCDHFEQSTVEIAKYKWPLFVNSICSYDRARYVFCKAKLEERFGCLKENYRERPFWIVSLNLLKENPALGVILEAKPTLFIDGVNGKVIPFIHKEVKEIKCEKSFPRKYKSPGIELYYAAGGGYLNRVNQLIAEGVNYNYKDTKSVCQYPLDCAKMLCQKEVADILMKVGAKEQGRYRNMDHCKNMVSFGPLNTEQKP